MVPETAVVVGLGGCLQVDQHLRVVLTGFLWMEDGKKNKKRIREDSQLLF